MAGNRKDEDRVADADAPALSTQDWDEIAGEEVEPEAGFENGDFRYEDNTRPPEEDDDNPYQRSDEALPGEAEEAAIDRRNRAGLRDGEA